MYVDKRPLTEDEQSSLTQLVDEDDLFPSCSIDQSKYTIGSNCDPGVLLYCRNEFFPLRDTTKATKESFEEICQCVDFLCATLPSGGDVTNGYRVFVNILYGLFASYSIICFLCYILSSLDLIVYGGFRDWLGRGFGTWSISGVFFFVAAIFFITQLILGREIKQFQDISKSFDLDRIPAPSNNLQYTYYDKIIFDLLDVGDIPINEEDYYFFLNDIARDKIPGSFSCTFFYSVFV